MLVNEMFTWTPYPFLRILAAFGGGILFYNFSPFGVLGSQFYPSLLIGLTLCFLLVRFLKLPNRLAISGNIGLLIVFLLGMIRLDQYRATNDIQHIIHEAGTIEGYSARVNSGCVDKGKYHIYQIDIMGAHIDGHPEMKTGKVHLYVRKNGETDCPLGYGDKIALAMSPFRLPPPKNPHEFNYQQYMAGKNIYYQQFVDRADLKILEEGYKNSIMATAIYLRGEFAGLIDQYVAGEQEKAIAQALILGIRDGLDQETKRSFSATGAMHVLAVSGLHVGIIIIIISFLLKPIKKKKGGKFISAFVCVVFLWFFAMVTGLSPSILRAVTMFSIIIIGQAFYSRPSIYNSLALSAFVLLWYDPNFMFSVGFQLSYIAVLGIVYIYPKIYGQLTFYAWLPDKIWSVTCLSVAAQLATFPLTLYYFHQFPVYFLISNLIVIPAAFLIMSLGITLIALGYTVLAPIIGGALHYLISGLNFVVSFIEDLNLSLIDWLYLTPEQTILIYLMIAGWCCLCHYRQFRFAYGLLVLALAISAMGTLSLLDQSKAEKLIFYEIGGESVFDQIKGLKADLVEVRTINNLELVRFQVEPNRLNNHLGKINENNLRLVEGGHAGIAYYWWKGKKFVFVKKPIDGLQMSAKIEADYLVISNDVRVSAQFLKENIDCKEIIVDSSNSYLSCRRIERMARALQIKCRILRNEGALTISL